MIRLVLIWLTALIVSAAWGQTGQSIRFYLTETDVLSDHHVPFIEVKRKAHWEGTFDKKGHLLTLIAYNPDQSIRLKKEYSYTKNGNLSHLREWDGENHLVSEMIMGLDEDAVRFVRYLYGVSQMLEWGDRFTIRRFNRDGIPFEKTFYEADGNPYGRMEDIRDAQGRIRFKIWTRLPEREVIRRWEYTYELDGGYTLRQFDRSGNLVEQKVYNSQGQRVIITLIPPDTSRRYNELALSYQLSDSLKSGTVSLTDVSGTVVNEYELPDRGLLPGQHRVVLDEHPEVSQTKRYGLVMVGETYHEGPCQSASLKGIRFDTEPPVLRLAVDTLISQPVIHFTTSEPLAEGSVVWIPDSATVLSPAPRLMPLTAQELTFSDSSQFLPRFAHKLDEEGRYRVILLARDFAGNLGKSPAIPRVTYDPTPPEIELLAPQSQTIVGNSFLRFSVNEALSDLTVWIHTSKGRFQFALDDRQKGLKVWRIPESVLSEVNEIGKISLVGRDRAGNVSDTAMVRDLRFDFDTPTLTVIFPISNAKIRDGAISVVGDEPFAKIRVVWNRLDEPDSNALEYMITDVMNQPGEKFTLRPPVEDQLNPEAWYRLEIMGVDSAGNPSITTTIDSLVYDPRAPEFIITTPEYGEEQEQVHLDFEISESLTKGWLYLQKIEPPASDTILVALPDSVLGEGLHHYQLSPRWNKLLQGEYRIWLVGEDQAGNVSELARVNKVKFK